MEELESNALSTARDWSHRQLEQLRAQLRDVSAIHPGLQCAVVSGSLARLDACPQSDIDLIVVLGDDVPLDSPTADAAMDELWERLSPLGLRRSRSDGVFASPTSRAQLCDGPRGIVAEDMGVFGKRIHLLLEARPIAGPEQCQSLQLEILRRYAEHPFGSRSHERWSYLIDDLIRYWRSYRVWRQWDLDPGGGGWALRNVKLRHSRLLSYASLLSACLACQQEDDVERLQDFVECSPLERLERLDRSLGTGVYEHVCKCYGRFLGIVNDSTRRRQLEAASGLSPDTVQRELPWFEELMHNGDQLQAAIWSIMSRLPAAGLMSGLL